MRFALLGEGPRKASDSTDVFLLNDAEGAEMRLLMLLCIRRMYSLSIIVWAPQRDNLRDAVCDIS